MNSDLIIEGLPIAIIGYLIVFFVLVILYIVFFYLAKLLEYRARKRCERAGRVKIKDDEEFTVSGEVCAAISLALHLHFDEKHDNESGKLTVKRVSKTYTPWNSKIYSVMNRL